MNRLFARIVAVVCAGMFPTQAVAQDTLQVLWHSPVDTASASSVITIMFDRPVAPALDSTIRASSVVHIEPKVAGAAAWRDPATIRFVPSTALQPGVRYTVRIDTSLRAVDGSRVSPADSFTFRVVGARLLARSFRVNDVDTLAPDGRMQLIYSAPVDLAPLQQGARLELSHCPGAGTVSLTAIQRPLGADDPQAFQYAGIVYTGGMVDSLVTRFRTVVELEPVTTLPLECDARVVIPTTADEAAIGREERYLLRTAAVPRALYFDCWFICEGDRLTLRLSSPVRRADVVRYVRLNGDPPVIDGESQLSKHWTLRLSLRPRSAYAITIDSAMGDAYGRPLEGPHELTADIGDYSARVGYPLGVITVPRSTPATLPVRSRNVRVARVIANPLPDTTRITVMSGAVPYVDPRRVFAGLSAETTLVTLPDRLNADTTTMIPIPRIAMSPEHPMVVVRIEVVASVPEAYTGRDYREQHLLSLTPPDPNRQYYYYYPLTLVQVTDLAVTARLVGASDGSALVTGLADGEPRRNVTVTQTDAWGRVVARGVSDIKGVATLARVAPDTVPPQTPVAVASPNRFTSLRAQAGDDHVVVSLGGGRAIGYQPGSQLNVESLGGRLDAAPLAAGALVLDRDIFRPDEVLHVKGIVRRGMLGDLAVPATPDSARVVVRHQPNSWAEDSTLVVRDTVIRLSAFGTIVDSVRLRDGLPLGSYAADLRILTGRQWRTVHTEGFRIAEYRAPEFLVDMTSDTVTRFPGDTVTAGVRGTYLLGAPMRHAVVKWTAQTNNGYSPFELPRGWIAGGSVYWARHWPGSPPVHFNGTDTLDASGAAQIRIPAPAAEPGFVSTLILHAAVVDLTNQTVTADRVLAPTQSGHVFAVVPETSFSDPWRSGRPASVDVRAVDYKGVDVPAAVVGVLVVRRRTVRADPVKGTHETSVVDTLRRDELRPNGGIARVSITPDSAGEYGVELEVTDSHGHVTRTGFTHSVGSPGRTVAERPVPPLGYRAALRAEKAELTPGQVARLHYDSPFADAEAWITIEREGIIEQRRARAHRGENAIDVAILPRYAPNVWMSVVLTARGEKSAPDSATQRIRAGYLELRITPDAHRLSVAVAPERTSYAPRDTTRMRVRVSDAGGKGVRSEVALWAVDEGVLSMTGMRRPDVVAQMYTPRGVGGQLWSTLPTMLTTNPWLVVTYLQQAYLALAERVTVGFAMASVAGNAAVSVGRGAGMGRQAIEPPRSRFNSTAFYLGAVVTNDSGRAIASAPVPDNLTTFRVFAVAVSAGDQYGTGDTALLVTKPLVARAALPRFVRASDSLLAGLVITARDGRSRPAVAEAAVTGATMHGPSRLNVSLSAVGDARTHFVVATPSRDAVGDDMTVRFSINDGATADAVETRVPVRPDFHVRTHAVLGATRDSQTVTIALPADIDPAHSRLRLRIGTSRLSAVLASYRWLRAYPYDCTEQLSSVGRGIVAAWEATKGERPEALGGDPHAKLQEIADEISRRQRSDGAFKYWPTSPWSSPWLTAYAGEFLLDARDLGVSVSPSVIRLATTYLREASRAPVDTGGINRFEQRARRLELGERIAAVEFLRRAGSPDSAAERALIRVAKAMTWEDRLRIAEVVAARANLRASADSIVDAAWREVSAAGHRVQLPDSSNGPREFPSRVAPAARLLSASLVLRPDHPLLAGLVETVLQQGRAESAFAWNTQDYASLVRALAHFSEANAGDRVVTARAGDRSFVARPPATGVDTTIAVPLSGLLETSANGRRMLRLRVDASSGTRPVYYALEVEEVPLGVPVTPDVHGIAVERSYERFDDGAPIVRVSEGELVRVRLRVTVPADRQFVALEDPLPAGLEPVDVGLRTSSLAAFTPAGANARPNGDALTWQGVLYGSWDDGHWSPWEHKELHDDRVSYFARVLWTGTYTATYVARATTAGNFVAPPAYAEEMYNPALQGRTAGYRFVVQSNP